MYYICNVQSPWHFYTHAQRKNGGSNTARQNSERGNCVCTRRVISTVRVVVTHSHHHHTRMNISIKYSMRPPHNYRQVRNSQQGARLQSPHNRRLLLIFTQVQNQKSFELTVNGKCYFVCCWWLLWYYRGIEQLHKKTTVRAAWRATATGVQRYTLSWAQRTCTQNTYTSLAPVVYTQIASIGAAITKHTVHDQTKSKQVELRIVIWVSGVDSDDGVLFAWCCVIA